MSHITTAPQTRPPVNIYIPTLKSKPRRCVEKGVPSGLLGFHLLALKNLVAYANTINHQLKENISSWSLNR
jgi:hypothetical protein